MHGLIGKLILDTIDELRIPPEKTVLLFPPGCGPQQHRSLNFNMFMVGLGRSVATATGFRRGNPDHFILCWDGDGADAAIGIGDVIHSAARNENITVVMVNNSLFANTGGQMAPTTLMGQKSSTSPRGRQVEVEGYPINLAEIIATVEGTRYSARVAVFDPQHVMQAKKAIKKAFSLQLEKKGFSYVEFVSNCPTNWHMTPLQSIEFIKESSLKQYPLGEFKTCD
jgi:2-oxoglutarate ferredoxin oxidoreductase subunit beta